MHTIEVRISVDGVILLSISFHEQHGQYHAVVFCVRYFVNNDLERFESEPFPNSEKYEKINAYALRSVKMREN